MKSCDIDSLNISGHVFNIQRYCIHDGPGIRTTVFLKGCSMKCFWCHNPESFISLPQLLVYPDKCIGCGKCFKLCPAGAHRVTSDKGRDFARDLCTVCGVCADACYAEALVLRGFSASVDHVITEVLKDRSFYDTSGGGVTFSGGEPLLQRVFIEELLKISKAHNLHTVVETAGNVPADTVTAVMQYVDLWLYDIKILDEEKHIRATGKSNRQILENLTMLVNSGEDIIVRIPVITGFNDDAVELEKIAVFISGLKNVKSIELLPFNNLSQSKYESLGMVYGAAGIPARTKESVDEYNGIFLQHGLFV